MPKIFLKLILCFLVFSSSSAYSYQYDVIDSLLLQINIELESENFRYDDTPNFHTCGGNCLDSYLQKETQDGSFFAFIGVQDATKDTRVFHRRNDPIENIEKIKESGELRGNPPTNVFASDIPKVQAFDGPLPPGQKGFEFTTPSIPDKGSVPGRPDFSGNGFNPTVETRNGQAVIKCTVTKVSC